MLNLAVVGVYTKSCKMNFTVVHIRIIWDSSFNIMTRLQAEQPGNQGSVLSMHKDFSLPHRMWGPPSPLPIK